MREESEQFGCFGGQDTIRDGVCKGPGEENGVHEHAPERLIRLGSACCVAALKLRRCGRSYLYLITGLPRHWGRANFAPPLAENVV